MIEAEALTLTKGLTLVAILLQSLELLALRKIYSPSGPWAWRVIGADFNHLPRLAKCFFDFLFQGHRFEVLEFLRLLAALALLSDLAAPSLRAPLFSLLLFFTWLSSIRFRGSFNGGSDSMIFVLSTALAVQAWFPNNLAVTQGALFYVAIHSIVSYVTAGFVKLKNPKWRSGQALKLYLRHSTYDVPARIKNIFSPKLSIVAAWSLIVFELGFAFIFVWPFMTSALLMAGVVFHLGAFVAFGLNRFFFAWVATYPAIIWAVAGGG